MIQDDFEAFARLMALLAETFNKDFTVGDPRQHTHQSDNRARPP
jgi:hypothetical protein